MKQKLCRQYWKLILERKWNSLYTQQLKRLKQWLLHENGVRLVVLLGVIGLVMILLSGLHDTGSKETKSSVSAESATDATLLTAET